MRLNRLRVIESITLLVLLPLLYSQVVLWSSRASGFLVLFAYLALVGFWWGGIIRQVFGIGKERIVRMVYGLFATVVLLADTFS